MLSKDGQLWMHWSQWGLGECAVVCRTRHMSQLRFSVPNPANTPMCQSRLHWLGHTAVYKHCPANSGAPVLFLLYLSPSSVATGEKGRQVGLSLPGKRWWVEKGVMHLLTSYPTGKGGWEDTGLCSCISSLPWAPRDESLEAATTGQKSLLSLQRGN